MNIVGAAAKRASGVACGIMMDGVLIHGIPIHDIVIFGINEPIPVAMQASFDGPVLPAPAEFATVSAPLRHILDQWVPF